MILTAKELLGKVPTRLPLGERRRVVVEGVERVVPRKAGSKLRTTESQRRGQRAYEERHRDRVLEMKRESATRRYWSAPEQFRERSRESMKRHWRKVVADPALKAAYNAKRKAQRERRMADPEYRAKELAYKATWRAKRKAA
jgi:hypothetical protein